MYVRLILILIIFIFNSTSVIAAPDDSVFDKELFSVEKSNLYIPTNAYDSVFDRELFSVEQSNLYIPTNAYASGYSWKCSSGYIKKDNNCIKYITKTNTSTSSYKKTTSSFTFKGLIDDVLDYTGLSDTNQFNAKLYNSPSISQAGGGFLYGDQLFSGDGSGMIGYVRGGYVYDTSMRMIGFVSNNTIYDTQGQYISPLGLDTKPGKVDMFDTSTSIFNSNNHTFDMTPNNGTNQRKSNTPGLNYNSGSVDMFDTSAGIFNNNNSIFNSSNYSFDMTPGF